MSLQKILIVPDCHFPFHNKKAFELMIKAGKKFKPDVVVVLGDFWDFYSVSDHLRDADRKLHFKEEIESGLAGLAQLELLGAKRHCFLSGNHEERLIRHFNKLQQNHELQKLFDAGILSKKTIQDFFGRLGKKWEFTPYRKQLKIGKMTFIHDLGQAGLGAVTNAETVMQGSVVMGHVHSNQMVIKSNLKGKTHCAASFGWLGDSNEIEYMAQATVHRHWSLGFGLGFHNEKNGYVYLNSVPIVSEFKLNGEISAYTCLLNGEIISHI